MGSGAPCVVGVLIVHGNHRDHLGVACLELSSASLPNASNLGGAKKGEVLRPEEDDAPGVFVQARRDGGVK